MVSLKASSCIWKGSRYQHGVVCLVIGRSTSHFQSPFSSTVLAALCVCEEAKGGRIGVGMKVGHSRFCLVARENSRLTLTPPEWWKSLVWRRVATFSMLVLQICMCYLCHVAYPAGSHITLSFGWWWRKQELLGKIFLFHQIDKFWTQCCNDQLPAV